MDNEIDVFLSFELPSRLSNIFVNLNQAQKNELKQNLKKIADEFGELYAKDFWETIIHFDMCRDATALLNESKEFYRVAKYKCYNKKEIAQYKAAESNAIRRSLYND